MSGGSFEYLQYRLHDIVEAIESIIIVNNNMPTEERYSEKTIEQFHKAVHFLKIAEIYTTRIDFLISQDDSEKSFHERLNEEIKKLISTLSQNGNRPDFL